MSSSNTQTNIFLICLNYIILIGELIGNTLNLIIFTHQKIFRSQQCIFYFNIKSIIDCTHLFLILISRISIDAFHTNLSEKSHIWCKLKLSIYQTCTFISLVTIRFAVIDQYLSTNPSPRLRKKSTLELAQALICINTSVWLLHGIPFLLFFEIQPSLGCTPSDPGFLFYYKFFHFPILIGFLPITIGTIFSMLAYLNVRRIIQRQIPYVQRRLDQQLTTMVLARVALLIIGTLSFVINRIYSLIAPIDQPGSLQNEIESVISNFTILIFTLIFSV
jgi:hypothetical protein